jgi:Protein of Unknown function (DUF2784)
MSTIYLLLADIILVLHFGVVLFIVLGLLLIWVGNARSWSWANHVWLRGLHLAAIGYVAIQSWIGIECPLTTLENVLRVRAGANAYESSFVEHWLHQLMFFRAPGWVFVLGYTFFALLVAWTWWRFPPSSRRATPH